MDEHIYPCWLHHLTRPSVLVESLEQEAALPDGYRYDPFTPEEQAAEALKLAAQAAQTGAASVPPPRMPPAPMAPPLHDVPDMPDTPDAPHARRR